MTQASGSVSGRLYTAEEYFEFEEVSDVRHNFVDGVIFVSQGGTFAHSAIISNVTAALGTALRGKPCRHLDASMRVRYGRKARFGYTDGLVVCGERRFDPTDARQLTLLNPTLIVEVLSPSTEKFDRGDKFAFYREIESFREYVLISQDRPLIETFFRQDDGAWRIATFEGLDARATLASIGVELPARDVFLDVEFPPPPTPPTPVESPT